MSWRTTCRCHQVRTSGACAALRGAVAGPWSASGSFRVVASPATPPGLELLWIIPEPGTVERGAPTQARVTLNDPAPAGGATVRIISDMPGVEVPAFVTIPAGSTDATVSAITTVPVGVGIVGTLRADYGTSVPLTSFGMVRLLFSVSLSTDNVAGGTAVTGTFTLQRPAPAGGIDVTIVSSDTSLARPPAHVVVAAGETSASFSIATATVAAAVPVVFDIGTANDGYHAPQARLTIRPAGSAAPAASLSAVTLTSPGVVGGTSATGTVTLTGPAPAGGASAQVTGSSSGTQLVNVDARRHERDRRQQRNGDREAHRRGAVGRRVDHDGDEQHEGTGATDRHRASRSDVGDLHDHDVDRDTEHRHHRNGHVRQRQQGRIVHARPWNRRRYDATDGIDHQSRGGRDGERHGQHPGECERQRRRHARRLLRRWSGGLERHDGALLGVVEYQWRRKRRALADGARVRRCEQSEDVSGGERHGQQRRNDRAGPDAERRPRERASRPDLTATATVTKSGASAASGFSVRVSFTPSGALRLQNPTTTSQSVPTVAAGGSQGAWQMRADNSGTAVLTMTLRDAGGAIVRTVSQAITITN